MHHIIKTSLVITVIVGASMYIAKTHLPQKFAQGYVISSILTIANFFFLNKLVIYFTNAERKPIRIFFAFFGMTVTIGGLAGLAYLQVCNPVSIVVGFSAVLGILLVQSYKLIKKEGLPE